MTHLPIYPPRLPPSFYHLSHTISGFLCLDRIKGSVGNIYPTPPGDRHSARSQKGTKKQNLKGWMLSHSSHMNDKDHPGQE